MDQSPAGIGTVNRMAGNQEGAEENRMTAEQERDRLRTALERIRDETIPQGMSPSLWAEVILRGADSTSPEQK